MDSATVLAEVRKWPIEQQQELVEQIEETLYAEPQPHHLTPELKAELERRIAEYEANPHETYTQEEVWEYIKRPR